MWEVGSVGKNATVCISRLLKVLFKQDINSIQLGVVLIDCDQTNKD